LALQKLKEPRQLAPEQIQQLVAALRQYSGKKFWIITQRTQEDQSSEQVVLANQLSSAFLLAGWLKTPFMLADPTKADPEAVPINDRGCNVASAIDLKSLAIRSDVLTALENVGIECVSHDAPTLQAETISLEVALH
jgi:hypothetical protein